MSWTKGELREQMFEIVDILQLSGAVIEEHGPLGTPVPELVRMVLAEKDQKIRLLQAGFIDAGKGLLCSE